jgi:hypothetical protein
MMRLGRKASLLVALSLLTSTATAYAECAWVLGEGRISMPDDIWTIRGTFVDARGCNTDLVNRLTVMERQKYEVTRPQSGSALYKRGESRGYLHCLPETVDPRGPKGK